MAAAAVGVVFAIAGGAFADNVQNDVAANPGSDTFVAGGSTSVGYRITATSGDGQTGCNAADSTPATVTINAPAGVTATPGSRSFTTCGTTQSVAFTSNTPGDYTITASVSDSGVGTYNTIPATFTLHVTAPPAPPDTTAPSITANVIGTLGNNGWYTSDVTVSWTVTDEQSNISSSTGCGSTTISSNTAGTSLTCAATSAGGTNSQSVTIKRDATAPSGVSTSLDDPADHNGWYNNSVGWTTSGSDAPSGIASCSSGTYSGPDGTGLTVSGSCTDNAGNTSASATSATFKYDATAPTSVSTSLDDPADHNGWYNNSVGWTTSGSDAPSGIASCSSGTYSGPDGTGLTVSGSCTDNAGNTSASATSATFNYDATAPTVSVTGVTGGATYTLGSAPTAGCNTTDATSHVATNATVSLSGGPVGAVTATCSGAEDNAGNTNTASVTYTVVYSWTGFFQPIDNGVMNVAKAGSTIPVKFSLGGDQGLNIFWTATAGTTYPNSGSISCAADPTADAIEEYSTATVSGLKYDATANQYIYNWKTASNYAGTCRQLIVRLKDGTYHRADFKFTK
jgi:hypothetical protein